MTSLHPHLLYASWVGTGRATLLATNPLPHRTHSTALTPHGSGTDWAEVAILIAVALVVGGLFGRFLASRDHLRPTADWPPKADLTTREDVQTGDAAVTDTVAERRSLVNACIRVRDMVSSGAVRRILGDALAEAGVMEVDPTGQQFNPDVHCSVGLVHTKDPTLEAVIASAERVGYQDRGRQLRPPNVYVFTHAEAL